MDAAQNNNYLLPFSNKAYQVYTLHFIPVIITIVLKIRHCKSLIILQRLKWSKRVLKSCKISPERPLLPTLWLNERRLFLLKTQSRCHSEALSTFEWGKHLSVNHIKNWFNFALNCNQKKCISSSNWQDFKNIVKIVVSWQLNNFWLFNS